MADRKHGCIIMASGEGKRFGGNKLTACLDGKPLIEWVLNTTDNLFAYRVVVTRSRAVADLCRRAGVDTCLHDLPLRSDTVRLGMERMPPDIDRCMFCQADQPLLTRRTIEALCSAASQVPEAIWRPVCGDMPGAPVLFPRWTFDELSQLPAGKGGGALIRKYPEHVRCVPVTDPHELMDVDTREDLAQLEAYLQEKGKMSK